MSVDGYSSAIVFGILSAVLLLFLAGTIYFFRRYRIAQVNWNKVSEKLREAIELAGNLKQVMDQVLEKYPDALEAEPPGRPERWEWKGASLMHVGLGYTLAVSINASESDRKAIVGARQVRDALKMVRDKATATQQENSSSVIIAGIEWRMIMDALNCSA